MILKSLTIWKQTLSLPPSQAPGRLCDFWPTESIWAYVKDVLPKKVSQHSYWKKGVGAQHGRGLGEGDSIA